PNVFVSAGIGVATSYPGQVVQAALSGALSPVASEPLLTEYLRVLRRPRFAERLARAGRAPEVLVASFRDVSTRIRPAASDEAAPDPNDQHLWDLLLAVPDAILVTGDRLLLENPPEGREVLSPRAFVERYLR
ncbi:MAG: putative toxin-antitoxin system toxin component, PIN family, partial [Anaerolinea sp.]|nr:putative toxin-antitoxin system toxin component, PIN family [Anaerolinea sp.]